MRYRSPLTARGCQKWIRSFFLEARPEASLGTLDGETGEQGPDPRADTGVFQRIEPVAVGRGADKEREVAQLTRIEDTLGRFIQRLAFAGFAILWRLNCVCPQQIAAGVA